MLISVKNCRKISLTFRFMYEIIDAKSKPKKDNRKCTTDNESENPKTGVEVCGTVQFF